MMIAARLCQLTSLLFMGAIFGFFYAYVVSGINGLNALPAPAAIDAMNQINNAVRNVGFMPVFFFPPVVCLVAASMSWLAGMRMATFWLVLGGMIYLGGGLVLTANVNVPLNEALKRVDGSAITATQAAEIWTTYAAQWSYWNLVRTVFSGIALVCVGIALMHAPKQRVVN